MSKRNDLLYVASLLEYTGRKTRNRLTHIATRIGPEGIADLFRDAAVNHCLSFEQVSDELVERYHILEGTFEPAARTSFRVPSHTEIGQVYMRLVEDVESDQERYADRLHEVLCSPIADEISDVRTSFFFAPRGEIKYFYQKIFENRT